METSNKPLQLYNGQRLTLAVDNLSFGGGRGVARHQGLVIFVPDVITGETVEVEITKIKKNFAEAKLIKVLNPSKERTEPPCPFFYQCGGCTWQHISYQQQLQTKQIIFSNFLKAFEGIEILDLVPSPKSFSYRNRIQLHKFQDSYGYHQRNSNQLVAINRCEIADEKINEYLPQLQKLNDGRYEVYLDKEGKVSHRRQNSPSEAQLFSQVNQEQNLNLIDTLILWLKNTSPKYLLELFSGSGNFTFPIKNHFRELPLLALEGSRSLVNIAIENASEFKDLEFSCADLSVTLPSQVSRKLAPSVDTILLDPPRIGCSQSLLKSLLRLNPNSIFYISCDPASLKRDLDFLAQHNYKPIKSQAFDMFPQTEHIESLTLIKRF